VVYGAAALGISSVHRISEFTSITALTHTCHALYRCRLATLCDVGRSMGVRWHRSARFALLCSHVRRNTSTVVDALRFHPVSRNSDDINLIMYWFNRHGYVATNPITAVKSVTLYMCVVGGHVILDSRGRTAESCTIARLVRHCRYSRAKPVAHICDLNCHLSGSYIRDPLNDVIGSRRVHPGDTLRVVFVRDDLWAGENCCSIASVFKFVHLVRCEVAYFASSHISYAQNMATLVFIIALAQLAGLWDSQDPHQRSPLPIMTWNAYVQLNTTHAPVVISSRCVMSGSLHYHKRLRASRSACIKGVIQTIQVVRVHALVIVGGVFTTVGTHIPHRPLVYQCAEIHVIKCLPMCVGTTVRIDNSEFRPDNQLCYFEQSVYAVPMDIYVTTCWSPLTQLIPLQSSTRYRLIVDGSVPLSSIPSNLVAGAESVMHRGIDISHVNSFKYMRNRIACTLNLTQMATTWL
jgi:hypothetical protein